MKDYNNVVTDRFNKQSDEELSKSIYLPTHPIGAYSQKHLFKAIDKFLKWYDRSNELQNQKILDLGCGHGKVISYFNEKGFQSENCLGVDFSDVRIERAQKEFPKLRFEADNALTFDKIDEKFHLITSFDLFSHFSKKEDIIKGIKNVQTHLTKNGYFLWYDIYAKDHFSSASQSDSAGFSKHQMIELAKDGGFELVYYKPVFKLFFNRYHSIYQAKRCPGSILQVLEKIIPGPPGNMLMVFKKK